DDLFDACLLALGHRSATAYNRFEQKYGIFQNVVDDDVVIIAIKLDLALRDLQPPPDDLIRFQHARLEPPLQFREHRRHYEDGLCIGHFRLHLPGALNIDIQDHILARVELLMNKRAGGAVELAVELRPLQKCAALDHAQECRSIRERIIDTVPFALPG